MSVEAIAWAFKQPIAHSSAKFVLVVMANCADGQDFIAWPSVAYIVEATGQNRKTVMENLKRLRDMGYLVDTGERKGSTGSVPAYRLTSPKNGTASTANLHPESSTDIGSAGDEADPNLDPLSSTENGTCFECEAVPKTERSSTVFGQKQSQKRTEAVPKTGHGTVKEPSREPSGTKKEDLLKKYAPLDDLLERGVDPQIADDWLTLRKGKKAPVTKTAVDLAADEAKKASISLNDALRMCCMRGWSGFKAAWLQNSNNGNRPSRQSEGDRRIAEFLAEGRHPYSDDGMTLDMEDYR